MIRPLALIALAAMACAADQPAATPIPYPLKTCIVSGEPLGSMGEPILMVHEGRQIAFCCKGCIKDFKRDPARFMAKLDHAAGSDAKQPCCR